MGPICEMAPAYEIAVGLHKGHRVTKAAVKQKHSARRRTRKNKFVKETVLQLLGHSPYEKRAMELLRIGKEKRCLRFLKKRLGTHRAAKHKRERLQGVLQQMRKAQAKE